MRIISINSIGKALSDMILEKNPVDDDIGIEGEDGNLAGVFITKQAYEFFLEKVEEEEDRIDRETVAAFHKTGEKNQ